MNLKRILISFFLGYFLVGCQLNKADKDSERPPNFIILFADDLGYGDLSCYGHPTIHTPNIDKLADEGIKLTQFYVAASICTPSRAGLLTGRLPVRSGMCGGRGVLFPDSDGGLPHEEVTIAEALKENGYATACVGKWHLGHRPEYLPVNHGFDYYFGIPYSNDMSPAQNDWEGARKFPPTPLIQGTEIIEEEPDQGLLTKRYTEHAIRFIEDNKDQHFFLYLPYTFPHVPLYASEGFQDTSKRGLYGDVVEEIDWSVGQIMKSLKENQLEENTFVMFTSDNGPWLVMDQHGGSAGLLRDGKGTTWEGGMREPAVIRFKGKLEGGRVEHAMTTTMDLLPTILKLAGATFPDDRPLDGVDIWPVLTGEKESVRDKVYYYKGDQLYAIRKGAWKAHFRTVEKMYTSDVEFNDHDPPLLFNVEHDPSERFEVSDQYPQIIDEMRSFYEHHIESVDKIPTNL